MSPRKRKNRNRRSNSPNRVQVMSLAEMALLREQLEQVSRPGTDPLKQAEVITRAMQFKDAYYYAGRSLRRVFPKASEVVLFHGVPQSASGRALLANFSGGQDAADQPQADPVRDQQ